MPVKPRCELQKCLISRTFHLCFLYHEHRYVHHSFKSDPGICPSAYHRSTSARGAPDRPWLPRSRHNRQDAPVSAHDGIKRSTVADQAYRVLRDWLGSGRFAPDERISERTVSAELGISRTPLRAALSRLEGDGLVRRLPSGALEVPHLTEDSAADLYACRSTLEVLAVELAVERASDAELEGLQRFIDEAARAYVRNELDRVVEFNILFHAQLVTFAANVWLEGLLHPVQPHFDRMRRMLVSHIRPSFAAEHQAILDAVKARDIDRAEQAVREHIADVLSRVVVTPGAVLWSAPGKNDTADRPEHVETRTPDGI